MASKIYSRALLLILFSAFLLPAYAQNENTGELQVNITRSDTRRPLSNAVIIIEARDGKKYEVKSDGSGVAFVEGLSPGLYSLAAFHQGFARVEKPSLRIVANKTTPISLVMLFTDEEIEEIVVTAEQVKADGFGSVGAVYRDREALRSATGSGSDVLRALDGMPGLVSDDEFASFSVRGRGQDDNLFFVDGLPFDKVVHFNASLGEDSENAGFEGGGRFSIFAPNIVDGVEFSPGGWSAAYGGKGASLLKLDLVQGNPTPSLTLRYDVTGWEMTYDGPSRIGKDTTLLLSIRELDFTDLLEEFSDDVGEVALGDIIFKSHTVINSQNTFELLYIQTEENYKRDVQHVLNSHRAGPYFEDSALFDFTQDSSLLGATWKKLVGENGELTTAFYYRKSDKDSQQGEIYPEGVPDESDPLTASDVPEDKIINPEFEIVEKESETGIRLDFTHNNKWGTLSAGLQANDISIDIVHTLHEDSVEDHFFTDDGSDKDHISITDDNYDASLKTSELHYAAYVEQIFNKNDWDFRAGLRYAYDGFSDETLISPRFAANWHYRSGLRFSFTAGTFYQSPSFLVRASDEANHKLKNEKTNHFSAGFTYRINRDWSMILEAYHQQLDSLVIDPDEETFATSNQGEGTSQGVDVVFSRKFTDGWLVDITYSFNDAMLNDNDGKGDYRADFSREHAFGIGTSWEVNDRWKLGARWKYQTGRPEDVVEQVEDSEKFVIGEKVIQKNGKFEEDNDVLNIRADYRRTLFFADFIFFIDILDVYDEATPFFGLIFEKAW